MDIKNENTYVLKPEDEERFFPSKVQKIIENLFNERLKNEVFDQNNAPMLIEELTRLLRLKVKTELKMPRYKLAFQVVMGEIKGQGVRVASKCLWDTEFDNWASASFTNESLYAVGLVFGCYYE